MHSPRSVVLLFWLACPLALAAGPATVKVPAGDVHEECMTLQRGDALRYAYSSDVPLAFNIHYHLGEAVYYPVLEGAATQQRGHFVAGSSQHYCMMWTNADAQAATLDGEFEVEARK